MQHFDVIITIVAVIFILQIGIFVLRNFTFIFVTTIIIITWTNFSQRYSGMKPAQSGSPSYPRYLSSDLVDCNLISQQSYIPTMTISGPASSFLRLSRSEGLGVSQRVQTDPKLWLGMSWPLPTLRLLGEIWTTWKHSQIDFSNILNSSCNIQNIVHVNTSFKKIQNYTHLKSNQIASTFQGVDSGKQSLLHRQFWRRRLHCRWWHGGCQRHHYQLHHGQDHLHQ